MSCARIFPSLVRALGWKVNEAASGTSTPALLASYDHDTQSWKTLERSLFEGSIEYSGALPRSGTMRNGKIYAPPMSERPTDGNESGLWPTPSCNDAKNDGAPSQLLRHSPGLNTVVKLWPTPRTAGMCGGTGNWNQLKEKCENIEEARKMGAGNGGQLSPDWVEWLMNYPIGWTNLDAKSSRISEPFSPEPDIPRVANSVKERVNRLKCLGNSIVPQIAELIFRQIKQL